MGGTGTGPPTATAAATIPICLAAKSLAYTGIPADQAALTIRHRGQSFGADPAQAQSPIGAFPIIIADRCAAGRSGCFAFTFTDNILAGTAFAGVNSAVVSTVTVLWAEVVVLTVEVAYAIAAGRFGGVSEHHRHDHKREQADQQQARQYEADLLQGSFFDDHRFFSPSGGYSCSGAMIVGMWPPLIVGDFAESANGEDDNARAKQVIRTV